MQVDLNDLELAMEFVSVGLSFGAEAYFNTKSGKIHYIGDGVEEVVPDDIEDSEHYLCIPNKRDLGLGRTTVLEFVSQELPSEYELISDYFSRKGAFSKFKHHIEKIGVIEQWYQFESLATRQALKDWCDENLIQYAD
ncbi:hypothetical protein HB761_13980 [Vibrio campbellii]|uniref:Uncharacterized protein n=1 Tax=Vibrio campbellii TaxID=680 RepID=A0AAE9N1E1_9VIBR|nr:UPF0158 family protein [Vibrio campbellii]UTZ27762.1 hypothetical protein HB761_13980 [Vibrio campbellii]